MPIPNRVSVTYCTACETSIQVGGLCLYGCQWDADTSRERPIIVRTYWLREPTEAQRAAHIRAEEDFVRKLPESRH